MRTEKYGLKVDDKLVEFVEANALPGIDISSDNFWKGLASIVNNLGPKNRELLQKRKELKQKIDGWHIENRGKQFDAANYKEFLKSIGYLVDEGADFEIETSNVDDEIANIAGPQLVVPITNSRFALNAANARFGSLYDSVYGTDVLGSISQSKSYDPARGAEVIAYAKNFLDETFPISGLSHADATNYLVKDGKVSKLFTVMWGIIAIIFASFGSLFENLIELVNLIGSIFYGTILGIFMVAFFFKKVKGNQVFYAACISQIAIFFIYGFTDVGYLWLNFIGAILTITISSLISKK